MSILKSVAGLFCLIVYVLTFRAVSLEGLAGLSQFFSDFGYVWRAQFNGDFLMYIVLTMAWAFYREETMPARILWAFLLMFGGVFFFPYVLITAIRSRGDVAVFFMGKRARLMAR